MSAYAYDGPVPEPEEWGEQLLESHVRSGEWLDQQVFPALSWAVPGIIPEGFGLFTGPPKAGKSWAALGIALAVASGDKALGCIDTGLPRPVLLLALEDGDRRLQGRCRALLGNEIAIPTRLNYATAATPSEVFSLIPAWLARYGSEQPLVVLDTLGKVMPQAHPGEGAYGRDYRVGGQLKALADAHPGSALMVVHHVRKATGEDWMDSTSGTNGLNGAADWTLNLSRPRNEEGGILRVTGRDVPENEYAVTKVDAGSWVLDGPDLATAASAAQTARACDGLGDTNSRIVAALQEHPQGVGAGNLAGLLGLPRNTVDQGLKRLTDSGRISKIGRGVYGPLSQVSQVSDVGGLDQQGGPDDLTLLTHMTGPAGSDE